MHLPCFRLADAAALPAAAASAAAGALARDDGDHRRHAGSGDGHAAAGDRAGEGGVVFAAAGIARKLIDLILTGCKTGDDKRLVKLRAAAGSQRERFAGWIARACDEQGETACRAALTAAGLQNDFVDDQCRSIRVFRTAVVRRIAQDGMHPLRIWAGCAAETGTGVAGAAV